jgi:redox-sensitive bicupin YhaK (pirin superfamily)
VHINQDVKLFASILSEGEEVSYELAEDRHAWVQLISGSLDVNGEKLNSGDGAAISKETTLTIKARGDNSEFLLFDLN